MPNCWRLSWSAEGLNKDAVFMTKPMNGSTHKVTTCSYKLSMTSQPSSVFLIGSLHSLFLCGLKYSLIYFHSCFDFFHLSYSFWTKYLESSSLNFYEGCQISLLNHLPICILRCRSYIHCENWNKDAIIRLITVYCDACVWIIMIIPLMGIKDLCFF